MSFDRRKVLARARVPMGFLFAALYFIFARPSAGLLEIGFPLALLGLLLRGWATGHIRKDNQLATTGPYALTRNPLYLGSFIIGVGFAIAGGRLEFLAVFLICFAAIYTTVIRNEEGHLRDLFAAQYEQYRQRVPLFFPSFRASGCLSGGFSFAQYWKNREYQAGLGFLGAAVLLIVKFYFS